MTHRYEPFYITELAFCGGNALLPNGDAFIVGGETLCWLVSQQSHVWQSASVAAVLSLWA